jgi:hypothetical protein
MESKISLVNVCVAQRVRLPQTLLAGLPFPEGIRGIVDYTHVEALMAERSQTLEFDPPRQPAGRPFTPSSASFAYAGGAPAACKHVATAARDVDELFKDAFAGKHADAAVKHFRAMVSDYQKSEWADAAAAGGKFIEAVMKALWVKATEEIDGRVYTEIGRSAPETALGILFYIYPKPMPEAELIRSLERHGYSHHNAAVAVQRLKPYVDSDGAGNVRLRNSGMRKAESLVSRAAESNVKKH